MSSPYLQPVPPPARIAALDALRGFALLGVVIQNLFDGSWPAPDESAFVSGVWFVFSGKFLTLFALLFGLGFGLQSERAQIHGNRFAGVYLWRQTLLLAIGVAHFLLLWGEQDVLRYYAVLGMLLIPFRRLAPWVLVTVAALSLSVSVFQRPIFTELSHVKLESGSLVPTAELRQLYARQQEAYRQGSYAETAALRTELFRTIHTPPRMAVTYPVGWSGVYATFLLGLLAARRRVLERPARFFWTLLAVALALTLLCAAAQAWIRYPRLTFPGPLFQGLAYGAAFLLLYRTKRGERWLHPFVWIGRTALSNYVLASLLVTVLYLGYGGGLYQRIPPVAAVALQTGLFVAQAVLSWLWLRRFPQGPLEWAWRSATWRKLQPGYGSRAGRLLNASVLSSRPTGD